MKTEEKSLEKIKKADNVQNVCTTYSLIYIHNNVVEVIITMLIALNMVCSCS